MVRTQVQLTDEQAHALKKLAVARGVSISALVREAVARLVSSSDEDGRWERLFTTVGKYRDKDGRTDVAEEHDRYLEDAYGS